jgi:diguanylate cyclase (GGDEF)-like protein
VRARIEVDANVLAEQLRVIYRQAIPASIVSLLISAVVCVILRDVTSRSQLAVWFGLLVAIAVFRFMLVRSFHRTNPAVEDMHRWERPFVGSLVVTSLIWGVGGVLIMPADSLLYQAVVYFFLMGMAGGAVASYSAHAMCTYVTICFVLLPSTAWFVAQDSVILRAMAAGGLVYVAAAIRATRTLSFFLRRSFQLSHELRIASDTADRLARTDELTGMKNRRAFYELAQQAFEQAARYERPLSLISLDIDHFKSINDTWGHAAGDAALRSIARVMTTTSRVTDIAGRVGGEEFAILLPETTTEAAVVHAERLRRDVADIVVSYDGVDIRLTCSMGVASRDEFTVSLDRLMARADAALYDAKAAGRNRVCEAATVRPSPF